LKVKVAAVFSGGGFLYGFQKTWAGEMPVRRIKARFVSTVGAALVGFDAARFGCLTPRRSENGD